MFKLNPTSRLSISTKDRSEIIDITGLVRDHVLHQGMRDGIVYLHCPHTTAGICINENADPDVKRDLLKKLELLVPKGESFYQHAEGNSDSHLKAIFTGVGLTIHVEGGKLVLGQWQGIYFCEFDGPRPREVVIRTLDVTRSAMT